MQHKIVKLAVIFLSLALQGSSQATEPSSHPLLDKYYPQAQKPATKPTETSAPQPQPSPQTNPTTVNQSIVAEPKPKAIANDTTAIKATNKPVPLLETMPTLDTNTITISQPMVKTSSVTPVIADTTAINKPMNTVVPVTKPQVQRKAPPSNPYRDTRLGSSSPLYDTYEKNSNGAGSVTTTPK